MYRVALLAAGAGSPGDQRVIGKLEEPSHEGGAAREGVEGALG